MDIQGILGDDRPVALVHVEIQDRHLASAALGLHLAIAAERDPELPLLVGRLVIMGGSFRSPGNTAPAK